MGMPMNMMIPSFSGDLLTKSGITPLVIKGKTILPIVQGGMGVGVSAHRLAGAVAKNGGMGTISSIDLRRLHPDLMQETQHLSPCSDSREVINKANIEALRREITQAKVDSEGFGLIAVRAELWVHIPRETLLRLSKWS